MNLPNPFPVARLRIEGRVQRTVHWPDYEGSVLRGLWGHALRTRFCATGQPNCEGCAVAPRCVYHQVFEPSVPAELRTYSDMTPPYVIEPADGARRLTPGQKYVFHLVLYGRALQALEQILPTWHQALAQNIGPLRGAMKIEHIELAPPTSRGPSQPAHAWTTSEHAPQQVAIEILSPLYLKREGRPINPQNFTAADFVWATVRRVAEISELHLRRPTGANYAVLKQASRQLRFSDASWNLRSFNRWSNRQKRHTPLFGVQGHALLKGDLGPFWPFLQLGEVLHIGGKTSFGLGCYRLTPVATPASETTTP